MFVENLRVLDNDPGARLSFDGEYDIAGGVLAEIVNRPAFTVPPRAHHGEWGELAHRRRFLRNEHRDVEGENIAAFRGSSVFETRIIDFAEIDAGLQDRREPALPSRIRL